MNNEDMVKLLIDIKSDVSATKTKVDSHDLLLKEYKNDLTTIHSKVDDVYTRTYNLDSWKNRLEKTITDEKEKAKLEVQNEFNPRLVPLEKDYKDRQDNSKDNKSKAKGMFWSILEKIIIFIAGGLTLLIQKIF